MSDAPKYVYRRGDGKPSGITGITHLMAVAHVRMKRGAGAFNISVNGHELAHDKLRKPALAYLKHQLKTSKVGDHIRVFDRDGKQVFACKGAKAAVKVINTSGNDAVDKVWSYEKSGYPGIAFLGAFVCKDIAGTNEHSQHAFGNAVDCGGTSMDRLKEIAHDLVHHEQDLSLENVIVADQVWTRGVGWHPYSGEFHFHVHADCCGSVDPSLPCGVRPPAPCR